MTLSSLSPFLTLSLPLYAIFIYLLLRCNVFLVDSFSSSESGVVVILCGCMFFYNEERAEISVVRLDRSN